MTYLAKNTVKAPVAKPFNVVTKGTQKNEIDDKLDQNSRAIIPLKMLTFL